MPALALARLPASSQKIAPPMISAAPIRRTGVMASPKRTAENTTAESGSREAAAGALLCRKRPEVADDGDGLDGQLGDGTKVEQATDAGVDDAEHDDGAPINTGGDVGGQE